MMRIDEIRELLPQRYPFLMVDRVTNVDLESCIIECYKNVSVNEEFFNGHFPTNPVMPGVLILEAMAQSAGILGFCMSGEARKDNIAYYFAASEKIRFKKPVVPGDQLYLYAEYKSKKRDIWKFSCRALVDDGLVSSAEITCAKRFLAD